MAIFGKNRITRGFTAEKVRNAINLRLPEYNLDLHLEVSRGFTTEMDSVVNSPETLSRKTFTVMLGFKISVVNPRVSPFFKGNKDFCSRFFYRTS